MLSKLEWSKLAQWHRHIEDVAGILPAMGVFGPTLSRKMDRGARTAGTMEECPACSRNPGIRHHCFEGINYVPKY